VWCGLPRDSVKVLNVVIPKVPDNELANTVYWTLQKEEPFDREEVILDYGLVREFQENSVTKILTIVYLANRQQIEQLQGLFKKIDFQLSGISSSTAELQNEIQKGIFNCGEESFSRLVLGENKSYIELYFKNSLVFSRDIKTGVSSFIDSLMEKTSLFGVIMDAEQCRNLILADDSEADETAMHCGLYSDGKINIFSLELPAALRLIRQMERTFDYFRNNFQIPRCTAVLLSGISFNNSRFSSYITAETGIPCSVHAPVSSFSCRDNMVADREPPDACTLVPAFGIALSARNYSQNFLFTREAKDQQRQEVRVTRVAVLVAAFFLLVCTGLFFWQHKQIGWRQDRLNAIAAEIRQGVFVDAGLANTFLMADHDRLVSNSRAITALSERYLPLVLAGRLCSSLPAEIKLMRLSINEERISAAGAEMESVLQNVSMKGVVTGSRNNMEFVLSKYIRKLSENAFIVSAVIKEKGIEIQRNQEVLTFTIDVQAAIGGNRKQEKPNV
jgi:Tfp pilus assembly PilM family ATPase